MWEAEDDAIFLKYAISKRDRAFHMVARDTACRPSALLSARIRDLEWINTDTYQVARLLINGKTGQNKMPITEAVTYLKDWLVEHPYSNIPNAYLFCGVGRKNRGRKLASYSINAIYMRYRDVIFPKLLTDPLVPPEERAHIDKMLRVRKWNPYIKRHKTLTDMSQKLSTSVLNQFAGWSPSSKMAAKYVHYFGDESFNHILEAQGISLPGKNKADKNPLAPLVCKNCNEPCKQGTRICPNPKCRYVLTYDAYLEKENEFVRTKQELEALKTSQTEIKENVAALFKFLKGEDKELTPIVELE